MDRARWPYGSHRREGQRPRRVRGLLWVLVMGSLLGGPQITLAQKKGQMVVSKKDPFSNRGKALFWLQDPKDNTCLGPQGFTACDGDSVWVLADRKEGHVLVSLLGSDNGDMCLERKYCHSASSPVAIGKCKKCGAKHWSVEADRWGTVKVWEDKEKNCLVRARAGHKGAKKRKNAIEMQHCSIGYTPLNAVDAGFDLGFHLQTPDHMCFDGERFRICDPRDNSQRWGMGVRFTYKGNGERYLYKFFSDDKCLVRNGKTISIGDCNSWGAKRWSIKGGRLAHDDGRTCVIRYTDNTSGMIPCSEGFEHMSVTAPEELKNRLTQSPYVY